MQNQFEVMMLAYQGDDSVRRVVTIEGKLPEREENLLDYIFHYGQNMVQAQKGICSVSCGDVILLNNKMFLIKALGFQEITQAELDAYLKIDRRDRALTVLDWK